MKAGTAATTPGLARPSTPSSGRERCRLRLGAGSAYAVSHERGSVVRNRSLLLAFAGVVGLLVPGPVQAVAATGPTVTVSSGFNALSCPSPAVCVAVGAVETSRDNAAGQVLGGSFQPIAVRTTNAGRSWVAVDLPAMDANLRAVSCWSTTTCVAVGGTRTVYRGRWYSVAAVVLRIQGTTGSRVGHVPAGARALDAVSCPGTGSCVATGGALVLGSVQLSPELMTTHDGGATWAPVPLPISQGQLETVSCASVAHCVALGASSYLAGTPAAGQESRSRPVALWSSAPATSWHVAAISTKQAGGGPSAVSCQAGGHCLAVGDWFNWCWCGTGTPGRFGSAWATSDGGATWSETVLPVLDGYVTWYANAVSCWAAGCAMAATVSKTKPGSEYYAGIQPLSASGAPDGALSTSASGLRPQYVYGLSCGAQARCVAVGQNWARPAEATIETETAAGHWTTTFTWQGPGQAPTSGSPTDNPNTLATCPGSGTSTDRSEPSGFDDVTDEVTGGFGGVYAHIGPATVCRDERSNPSTSAWVMLQAGATNYTGCGRSSKAFVQAGVFYSYPLGRAHSDHAFVEVDYPCLTGNGTHEFWGRTVTSGTFGVEDLGLSTSHANCPGTAAQAGGDGTDRTIDRVEATLDGSCLWVMDLPPRYAGQMHWADLAAEVHTSASRVPGTYQDPLVFSDAHAYLKGAWENFVTNGHGGASNPSMSEAPRRVVVDGAVNQGTGCQRQSGAGATWSVAMWAPDLGGSCSPT